MNRLVNIFRFIFGIATIVGIIFVAVWFIRIFCDYLNSIPKEIAAAIIAGVATILVGTLTVMVGRHFERKRELDALYRDKKTEIYDEFLSKFFDICYPTEKNSKSDLQEDLGPFLREFMRKLILWSGPEVIEAFLVWKEHLAKGTPDIKPIFLTEDFLFAIRKDLRHSNKVIKKGFFVRIFLREGELFLSMLEPVSKLIL